MSDIITERSANILSIQLNRPAKKNAMTLSMYVTMAELLNGAAKDDQIHVVLWHATGGSFSAGNDIEDFMKNPPAPGESPQAQLIHALIDFEKPRPDCEVPRGNSSFQAPNEKSFTRTSGASS